MDSPPREPGIAAYVADVAVACAIVVVGVGAYLSPRFDDATPESEMQALRITVLVLSLLTAVIWVLLRRARRELARIQDMLTDVLFGAGTKRDREAIDILVRALRAPDAGARDSSLRMLRKISGLELGEDPKAWEEWWSVARSTFTRPGAQSAKK